MWGTFEARGAARRFTYEAHKGHAGGTWRAHGVHICIDAGYHMRTYVQQIASCGVTCGPHGWGYIGAWVHGRTLTCGSEPDG